MKIIEIFNSIDGEVNKYYQGCFSTFVRLAGCNLNCKMCDTPLAHSKGEEVSYEDILKYIEKFGCKKITITGGEPLLDLKNFQNLVDILLEHDYKISVETNGTIIPDDKYFGINNLNWIVDYKLEFSNLMQNQLYFKLGENDWIKILIDSRQCFDRALSIKKMFQEKGCKAKFAFSPVFSKTNKSIIEVNNLIAWIQETKEFDIIINLQIHKLVSAR